MLNKIPTQIEGRPNFKSLLDEAPSEVKFSAPPPQGSYMATVLPAWRADTSAKGSHYHEFSFRLTQAYEDVDEDELSAWVTEHGSIDQKIFKRRFFITPEAIPYLDEFHQACGVDLSKKVSRLNRNDEVGNSYVGVYLKHRQMTDAQGKPTDKITADIDRFFKVEE